MLPLHCRLNTYYYFTTCLLFFTGHAIRWMIGFRIKLCIFKGRINQFILKIAVNICCRYICPLFVHRCFQGLHHTSNILLMIFWFWKMIKKTFCGVQNLAQQYQTTDYTEMSKSCFCDGILYQKLNRNYLKQFLVFWWSGLDVFKFDKRKQTLKTNFLTYSRWSVAQKGKHIWNEKIRKEKRDKKRKGVMWRERGRETDREWGREKER